MRVLVTGGYGFIGSNLVIRLKKLGYNIDIVDDMSNGHTEFLKDYQIRSSVPGLTVVENDREFIRFFNCDFSNDGVLSSIARGIYDCVFHLAACPRVSYSVENPAETTEINLNSTVKLFDAAKIGKTRVVFSSSSSVYGDADIRPTPEDYQKSPQSPYAWQKSASEDAAKLFCHLYDESDIVCLRYFNVFGPNQYGDSPYSTAVSAWCHAVKNGSVCRSDGDGTQSRDMCYVENVVEANILALDRKNRFAGDCYNIACNDTTTNLEILSYFIDNFGAKVRNAPWRPGDVMHTLADVNKAKEELGYEPTVEFWEGLERTVKWWGLK
jgi:nucleoside-diphosphate-sugar epimerase